MRDRGPDAEREADRGHAVAGAQVAAAAHRRRAQVVGDAVRAQHGQVLLGHDVDHRGLGVQAVVEDDLDVARLGHHVQVGQDDAAVDDHHPGADRGAVAVVLGLVLGARACALAAWVARSRRPGGVGGGVAADHAHHRGRDRLVGAGGGGRLRLGVEAVAHRGVDLLLGQRRRATAAGQPDRQRDQQRAEDGPDPGRCRAQPLAPRRTAQRRCGRLRRVAAGGRGALARAAAVERGAGGPADAHGWGGRPRGTAGAMTRLR